MRKHRISAGILVLSILMYLTAPVFSDGDTVKISNAEDFIRFSKNCTLDTWSQKKTILLTADIDMGNKDFTPVPTFGGIFNGNGYKLSGVKLTADGSDMGVFRYIQKSGKITDLKVEAQIIPGGSKSVAGGIAGENSGVIERCSFDGSVKGEKSIGGIAGKNTYSGQIISCYSYGNVSGESFTGGIAGENAGLILSSVNNAEVNTMYEEKKRDISDIDTDAGALVDNYKNEKEDGRDNEEKNILGHSDTGGIAGYTSGVVQGCENRASVGYKHIGYNIGGIAGRQSGYMLSCENSGFVQGRKDVGGIAGQVEPYMILDAPEGKMEDIRQELDILHEMVSDFISDTEGFGDDTERHFDRVSGFVKTARDNARIMLDEGTDFIDDNLDEINVQTAILSDTIDKLIPVFGNAEQGSEDLSKALDTFVSALDSVELYAPEISEEIDRIKPALDNISKAENSFNSAAAKLRRASDALSQAVRANNTAQIKSALSALSSAVKDMISAKTEIKSSLEKIETVLKDGNIQNIADNAQEILKNIASIRENILKSISAMQAVVKSIDTIIQNTSVDFSEFRSMTDNIGYSLDYLESAMFYVTSGITGLGNAVSDMLTKLDDYAQDMSGRLNDAKDEMSEAVTAVSDAADDIKAAVTDMKQILSDLSDEKTMEFVKTSDAFHDASGNLFASLSDISNELSGLKNTVSVERNSMTDNLNKISSQFNVVMNLMADGVDELKDSTKSLSERFLDVSDEDIENTKQGKIARCRNAGKIEADRNIGGIAGAMAVEYSKDPEDDIEKPDTFNFTYITKAVLQACVNEGEVSGKKDCAGGIAGLSEIGTIYNCENYGSVESTGGNYVGGIAGKSSSTIRRCYSKSKIRGERYVGGIAGKTDSMTACRAIVNVTGDENAGAIAGSGDRENLSGNVFVDSGLGAVDGISYKDAAEPVSFDTMRNMSGIPLRFIGFTVTFIADDKVVATQEIRYGDDIADIRYPEIPEKKGHFGKWQASEAKTVTEDIEIECEYIPYVTVLASSEKNDTGKLSIALAEGDFTDKASMHAVENSQMPPKGIYGDVRVYDVSLFNSDIHNEDTVTLRMLNENRDKVTAWELRDGEWVQIETAPRGKYVILKTTGAKNTICMQYTKAAFGFIWLILPVGIAAMILFTVLKKRSRTHVE